MKPKKNYKPGGQDVMLTPPHAIEPLLPLLSKNMKIWESATGPERLMEKAFLNHGFEVIGTDILYGQNYFEIDQPDYDIEITNLPFSLKYKWLEKAFNRGKKFCFIVPYETTFAKDFQRLVKTFNKNPFEINVLSPERRINFKTPQFGWGEKVWSIEKKKFEMKGDTAQMPTCWVTWGLSPKPIYSESIKTFYVPMRKVRYNEANEPIITPKEQDKFYREILGDLY